MHLWLQVQPDLGGVALLSNLQALTFDDKFNRSLEGVTLPSSLQASTFGYEFNQSLEGGRHQAVVRHVAEQLVVIDPWSLPEVATLSSLQSLTFGNVFSN